MERYFQEAVAGFDSREGVETSSLKKRISLPAAIDETETNPSGGFDCNICLDFVQDPVVTLCGHLYCWPCIYKWIHLQTVSIENADKEKLQCPVCKAGVSENTLVPLYGRGHSTKPSDGKAPHLGIIIPRRPPSPTCAAHGHVESMDMAGLSPARQLHHQTYSQHSESYNPHSISPTPMLGLGGSATSGVFGEMIYARIFGNSETMYGYPNSYHLAGSGSPRVRRHLMEADKSLSRVCFFLFCCIVLCLLLF